MRFGGELSHESLHQRACLLRPLNFGGGIGGGSVGTGEACVNVVLQLRHVHGEEQADGAVYVAACFRKVAKELSHLLRRYSLSRHGVADNFGARPEVGSVKQLQIVFCELSHICEGLRL